MFSVVHVLTDPTELTKLVDERGSTRANDFLLPTTRAKDVSWEGDGFQEGSSTSGCKSRSSLNVLKEIDEKRNLCSADLLIKLCTKPSCSSYKNSTFVGAAIRKHLWNITW